MLLEAQLPPLKRGPAPEAPAGAQSSAGRRPRSFCRKLPAPPLGPSREAKGPAKATGSGGMGPAHALPHKQDEDRRLFLELLNNNLRTRETCSLPWRSRKRPQGVG